MNDDFSYAYTVKRFVETGRFNYNGWSSAMLGVQALWGALFVKLFGFSHDVLRISILPLSMLCAWFTYRLHRRFEVSIGWSAFATLLLVVSPIFTPWSASFQTDIPGLLLALVLFHLHVSLTHATSLRKVVVVSAALVATGIAGGSVRQSLFPMTLLAFLLALWQHRHDRRALAAVASLLGLFCISAFLLIRWHAAQPYFVPELRPGLWGAPNAVRNLSRLGLDLLLFLLPLAIALLPALRFGPWRVVQIVSVVTAVLLVLLLIVPVTAQVWLLPPWVGNTITTTGLIEDRIDGPGRRPEIFPIWLRFILGVGVWSIVVGLLLATLGFVRHTPAIRPLAWMQAAWRAYVSAMPRTQALIGLSLIVAAYWCLLAPRASFGMIFDRYLLVVIPIVTLVLLTELRSRLPLRPSLAAMILLSLFGVAGIAITADHFGELRARIALASKLMSHGVPRDHIVNGLSFDAWTQLEARGYLNDERIVNPRDAYQPPAPGSVSAEDYWFLTRTPEVTPDWIILHQTRMPDPLPGEQVGRFTTLLPPHTRYLLAVRDVRARDSVAQGD